MYNCPQYTSVFLLFTVIQVCFCVVVIIVHHRGKVVQRQIRESESEAAHWLAPRGLLSLLS